MSSSRIRLYLDLKLSPLEISRARKLPYGIFNRYALTPAQYIKEMTSKWSIFEKPYYDSDSPRAMNFTMPVPDWPSDPRRRGPDPPSAPDWPDPPPPGGSFFPPPGEGSTWTFVFDPGICSITGPGTADCGDILSYNLWMGLPPMGQGIAFQWSIKLYDLKLAKAEIEENSVRGVSATAIVTTLDNFAGEGLLCGRASLLGAAVQKITVKSPFSDGVGILSWEAAMNLPAPFQVSIDYYPRHQYDCGCIELSINCCDGTEMVYDTNSSVSEIGRERSGRCFVKNPKQGKPYTYNISGTGFWLSPTYDVTILISDYKYVDVYTDASACGVGDLTITACDGNSVSGEILCTFGEWEATDTHTECWKYHVGNELACENFIYNNKKYKIWINCYDCSGIGTCDDHGCDIAWSGYSGCTIFCDTGPGVSCAERNCWGAGKVTYGNWICE